jgi:hypothetical protein
MPRQTSIQLVEATERQVTALQSQGFGSFTDIVRLAIDRMHREEIPMYYAISTLNDTATHRTGWNIYGEGQTENDAEENATDAIGGRGVVKTATEQTLFRNLKIVRRNELTHYGLSA